MNHSFFVRCANCSAFLHTNTFSLLYENQYLTLTCSLTIQAFYMSHTNNIPRRKSKLPVNQSTEIFPQKKQVVYTVLREREVNLTAKVYRSSTTTLGWTTRNGSSSSDGT